MAAPLNTFAENWYRLADQRIYLRQGVTVRRQNFRGQRWIVLENPFRNQFFRLRPEAYEFVGRLRPDRTVEEVWRECLEKAPDAAPGQEAVIQLLAQLYLADLLQYDVASDTARLFERYEKSRQRETRARWLNVMFMRFPLLDPDLFLQRTMPIARKLIGPFGLLLWLIVVGAGIKTAVEHWPQLQSQSEGVLAPANLPLLYLGMILVKTLHEFGHAYFCRRFGGEVHVMGIMFMIFMPMPYVDATSSWGFRQRWKRALVGAAGMIVELFVAAIAAFVWARTAPGAIHSVAYNIMFVASVSTIVFNINPLLRYDGYYILSDLLEIPNLYQRALAQLRHLAERYLFGIGRSESPAHSRSEAILLAVFGVLSGCYRVFVFSRILIFVADQFLIIGLLMAVACAVSWVFVPTSKFINYLSTNQLLERHRARAVAVSAGLAVAILFFLNFIPFPNHFRAPGVIESREWKTIVSETRGQIVEVLTKPGSKVHRGDPLVRLQNHELELELVTARAALTEVETRVRKAMQDATPDLKPLRSRLDSTTKRVHRLETDLAHLTITAPQDGLWVAPILKDQIGRQVDRGAELGLVLDGEHYEFTATVVQEDADAIFSAQVPGGTVRLRGQSENLLHINKIRVVQAEQQRLPSAALGWGAGGEIPTAQGDPQGVKALEPFFSVRAEFSDGAGAALLHGRAGKVRFDLDSEPLLQRWIRRLRQLLQKRYQL